MGEDSDEKTPLLVKQGSEEGLAQHTHCATKLRFFLSNISVEPVIFVHYLSVTIESVFVTNMMVDKICEVQLNYSKTVCENLDSGNYDDEEDTVQRMTNDLLIYRSMIEFGIGIFIMIFLGALGDARGQKISLLIPAIGATLKIALHVLNAYFWKWKPYVIVLSYIPYGLAGSAMAFSTASYAYIGSHSRNRSRTSRLSLVGLVETLSSPIGHALGTIIYMKGGYVYTFGASLIVSALSILYILFFIESGPPKIREGEKPPPEKRTTLAALKNSLRMVIKPREGGQRGVMIAYLFCMWASLASSEASSFLFLYTRKVFQWNYLKFNIYSIANTPVALFASCITIPLLSYHFQLEDSMLGFLGSISHIFYGIIVGTTPIAWPMYLALVVSSGSGMIFTSSRGALSKLVASYELGGIFSIVALGEALIPIIAKPIFTLIYNSTLEVFPGTIFLVGAFTGVIVSCIYTWILTSGSKTAVKTADV